MCCFFFFSFLFTADLDLFLSPLVQIDRFDLGDVDPQVSMDASTADTDEYAQVPGRPSRSWQRDKKKKKKQGLSMEPERQNPQNREEENDENKGNYGGASQKFN